MQVLRFGAVGVLNTAVDFVVLNILMRAFGAVSGPALITCNIAAFSAASLNSYGFNKRWTFAEESRSSLRQYTLFFVLSVGGLFINSLVLYLLTTLMPLAPGDSLLWRANAAKLCATAASMAWNYLAYRHVVFRGEVLAGAGSNP